MKITYLLLVLASVIYLKRKKRKFKEINLKMYEMINLSFKRDRVQNNY
jgi:hypothetical protein